MFEETPFNDYTLNYDAENRLVSVTGAATANFVYDGDGKQIKAGITAVYVGNHYEVKNSIVTKYYFAGSTRLAARKDGTLTFLLGDHLGSGSVTTNANGAKVGSALYKVFGETRHATGNLFTDYKFTGQREEASLGIYFFVARWFDPSLGRFAQADTLVPGGVQGYDRYAYVNNNPVKYNDPSGHMAWEGDSGGCNDVMKCIKEKQDAAIAEQKTHDRKCAAGYANHCSGWSNSRERLIIGVHIGAGDTMDIGYGGYNYEQTDYLFDFQSGTLFIMKTRGDGIYIGVPNGTALEGYLGITNVYGIPSSATPDQVAKRLAGPNLDMAVDVGLDILPDVETNVGKGLNVDLDPDTGTPVITSAGPMYATETKFGAGVSLLPLPIDVGAQVGHSESVVPVFYQLPFWLFR